MHAWTHTRTRSEREAEPTLAVIADTVNKRLRCNPEGFSASHKTEEEGGKKKKHRGESEEATALQFQRETRDEFREKEQVGARWRLELKEKLRGGVTRLGRAICSV